MTVLGEKPNARRWAGPDHALDFEVWNAQPPQGDELLACVAEIAGVFERPFAEARVTRGLALDDAGKVPLDQVDQALEQLGLRCELSNRPAIAWTDDDVPAILVLSNGRPVLLKSINSGMCMLWLPGAEIDIKIDSALVDNVRSGQAIIARNNPAAEMVRERPWDRARSSHWFWSEVRKERRQLRYVILASILINLLAFALPLFTMNVYDRIIPNKAAASLWVMAMGAIFAISVEYGLRLARTGLIDEVGRAIDARLSQRLLDKVLNLPLATQRGSTGALARRVTEYEQVRDFFASTTVVLITDILFLFVFVGLIAVLGGWLAVIPIIAMAAMFVAGWILQRKISAGEVDVGFTPEMVRLALGKPSREFNRQTENGSTDVWVYHDNSPRISFGFGIGSYGRQSASSVGIATSTGGYDPEEKIRVEFREGKVTQIDYRKR